MKQSNDGQSRLFLEALEPRILLTGVLAEWNFDQGQGSVATDSSGNGHTCQISGASWVAQGSGHAISLDGRDDYLNCGSAQAIGIGGPLTLEAWVKPERKANGLAVIMGEDLHTYLLTYYNTEIAEFYIGSGSNNVNGKLTLDGWNHVAATFDGSTIEMRINGILTQSNPSAFSSYQPAGNLVMGTIGRPDLAKFKGLLDNVRIYDRAISGSEARAHFEAEAGEHGFDPALFTEPQVTPYYYLHDQDPTVVVETEYVWLDPMNGRLEVTLANLNTPNDIILQRVRNPVPTSGAVDVTIPLSGLADGVYVINVDFFAFGVDYSEQFFFAYPQALPTVVSPSQTTVGLLPLDGGSTPYGFSLNSGGGFTLNIDGTDYPFQSRVSWPNGNYNLLADAASGESNWQVSTQALGGNRYRVNASGSFYSIVRDIEVFPTHVYVEDTYTNNWSQDLGLLVYNEVPVISSQVNQSLLSGWEKFGRQIETHVPDYGPSVFFSDSNTGIGIVPVDDVYVVQAIAYVDWQNAAGVGTEKFALAPSDSHTLEWAVYPTGSKDYYDFINAFRTVEGRTATIEKNAGFITQTPHVPGRREIPTADYIQKRGLDIGIIHNIAEIADDPDIHVEGIEFIDYPLERQLLTQQVSEIHSLYPDIDVTVHLAHSLFATNNPNRFADSRVIRADGSQASWSDGSAFGPQKQAEGWRWWTFYPTPGNSFHNAMMNSVDVLMDEMGFNGGFMDGFSAAYTGQYTYDGTWDGRSAEINPTTKTITRKMGSVVLLSQPSLIEYAQKIRDKDGVVIANNGVLTRSITNEDYVIWDNERSSGPQLHLAPSVTALSNFPFLSEKYIYFDMLDKLSWGSLYLPLTEGHDRTHESLSTHQFPITFKEIRSGLVGGNDKIVTMNSGIYGWVGDHDLHRVFEYDSRGAPVLHDNLTTVDASSVRTELILGENESAILETVPVTLIPTAAVNARVQQYDQEGILAFFNGQDAANLFVRDGEFSILANQPYEVSINGAQSTIFAQANGILIVPLALTGQTEVIVAPARVTLDVQSTPIVAVDISGPAGVTNYSVNVNRDSQVVLAAPLRAADSNSPHRFGFMVTQGLSGTEVYDSNGTLVQSLNREGKALEFDEDSNLFVGDSTPVDGKYPTWRYEYLGDASWGPAELYCEVDGEPRALALDAAGQLYIGLNQAWLSNVYVCSGPGQTPTLFGGANDDSRQIQDMEIDPDGKLWTSRVAGGYQRFPLSGGFEPELTIYNNAQVGGFEFGPDRNGDGKPELYGAVDGSFSNIGYYDYQSGIQLGTLISDEDIDNYSLTIGPDRNNDGVEDIHVLNYSEKVRIYDGVTGNKITEMAQGIGVTYVSSTVPKPYHFKRWSIDGVVQPLGQNTVTFNAIANTTAVAIFDSGGPVILGGDFDNSGTIDGLDIDFLRNAIALQTTDPSQDLNDDGTVNGSDVTFLLTDILETSISDVNLDRMVDALDLGIIRGNFGSSVPSGFMPWSQGNIIGDGAVDQTDLLALRLHFGYVSTAGPLQSASVPMSAPPAPEVAEDPQMASREQIHLGPPADIRQPSPIEFRATSPTVEFHQVELTETPIGQAGQLRFASSQLDSSGGRVARAGAYRDIVDRVTIANSTAPFSDEANALVRTSSRLPALIEGQSL